MTGSTRHLTWEHFDEMIRRGVPAIHRVLGKPLVDLFIDKGGVRIGLRTPLSEGTDVPPSPLAAIALDPIVLEGERLLEVSTRERPLYGEFYSFCVSLADRLQLERQDVIRAVLATLSNWRELLQPVRTLSVDRQVGLAGEIWLLSRLMVALGTESVRSWVGPSGEPHDFRLHQTEIEVKVTLGPTRSHVINGEAQLVASPDHQLWLLSLQLEPAGSGGTSLPEMIDDLNRVVGPNPAIADHIANLISAVGYRDVDRRLYGERWQFRTHPRLIPVDDRCPKITRAFLDDLEGNASDRIFDVHYRINVEGLGFAHDSEEFQSILPIGLGGLHVAR